MVQVRAKTGGTASEVVSIRVNQGDEVNKGDELCRLETMKMEMVIKSPSAGRITSVNIRLGRSISDGELLFDLEEK